MAVGEGGRGWPGPFALLYPVGKVCMPNEDRMACLMCAENSTQDMQYTGNHWDLEIVEFNVLYSFVFFFPM